ncbi:MAG: hypothetical protein GC162_10595 [Planctomycetes bacterium]|nr:hypothetical protein [Planctomycetota bacterium]
MAFVFVRRGIGHRGMAWGLGLCMALAGGSAWADVAVTGATGGSQPFDNRQPSLVLSEQVQASGQFPALGPGGVGSNTNLIGMVRNFPYGLSFLLPSDPKADGTVLDAASFPQLFSVTGTAYAGGNGSTTFAMPNLGGTVAVGASATHPLGSAFGSDSLTLSVAQMPAHTHTLPGGGDTDATGGGAAFDNTQSSLAMHYIISTGSGIFPSEGGGTADSIFLGQVSLFVGDFAPEGWMFAEGQFLPIVSNTALFSLLGTKYGGDGAVTFRLPDLQNRTIVGAGGALALGQVIGEAATTITESQLPAHDHDLPPSSDMTGTTGSGASINNDQPALALNYLIAIAGDFPIIGGPLDNKPVLGEVVAFAGDFAPAGWAFANGQTLQISTNPALFSLLGFTYGGDGSTTFALPDLRGRVIVGANGSNQVGATNGANSFTLTVDQLPEHMHTYEAVVAVPEPSAMVMMLVAAPLMVRRRRVV